MKLLECVSEDSCFALSGFILMEYCRVQMIEQGLPDSAAFLSNCKLLDTSLNGDADIQELLASLIIDSRKRKADR